MFTTQITNAPDQIREKNSNSFCIAGIDGFVLKICIRSGSIFDDRGSEISEIYRFSRSSIPSKPDWLGSAQF
jgi:hypothetical protein